VPGGPLNLNSTNLPRPWSPRESSPSGKIPTVEPEIDIDRNMQYIYIYIYIYTVYIVLVNNQIEANFFMHVYFYSLHVSGSHMPIIRRIIVSMRHLVYVTLFRRPSGMKVNLLCLYIYIYI